MPEIVRTGTLGACLAVELGLSIQSIGDWLRPAEIVLETPADAEAFRQLLEERRREIEQPQKRKESCPNRAVNQCRCQSAARRSCGLTSNAMAREP